LGVNANNSKDGIYVAQCIFDNTVCQANLYTDLTGCRFEGVISSAWLTNCTVNRCLFDGCDIGLDIEATVINEGIFRNCVTAFAQIEPAGANDFKNSDFYGNPLTPIFMAAGAVAPVTTFTLCDFEYWPTIGQAAVVFRHCTCKGATVNPDPVYVPFTNETVTYPYSGQDDHMGLWPEGVNKQFRDWPDPVLSKICYESVGVHGCAVPVELYQNRRAARIGLTDEHLGL
jgi:hypothetical protein